MATSAVDPAVFRVASVDPASRDRLAGSGFDYRVVPTDSDEFPSWLQVVGRGFLGEERTDDEIAAIRERSGYRRNTGVYDPTGPVADAPVATIASWIVDLTVPGGATIPSCAISAVTVAPTHRRRGIARALLEGELRAAADAGAPVAMLTVSESTLYGRYGFAPAAANASWRIDVKRVSWIGPRPAGRVDFVSRETARGLVEPIHERGRLRDAGEIQLHGGWWDTFAGTRPDSKSSAKTRAVRYADETDEVRGVAFYSVSENHDDFTKSTVTIGYLLAETDDAYAALWRFFLELDLVGEVQASELSVDEPLLWMLSDQRAATVTATDHQYVRIIDVPAALEARAYESDASLVLEVDDPLGFAAGRWHLVTSASGAGTVTRLASGETPDGALEVALGVEELSAAYLGGVSLATLAAAGRVETADAATAARAFGWYRAPRLSVWY